ncbi:MAG: hypothetical protein OXD44_01475 [Gammaproteobacteria bacterium]|nr:hypothetical protein [Gammaproteobacteria bacterium]MCY4312369.1 hypothetical protein [Gammaproteobacteria bacterium]
MFWRAVPITHKHLDNLARADTLKIEGTTTQEISKLIRSGTARLADAKKENLSPESRFDLVYNSAHALSLAALRMAGYRSGSCYLVFQWFFGIHYISRAISGGFWIKHIERETLWNMKVLLILIKTYLRQ